MRRPREEEIPMSSPVVELDDVKVHFEQSDLFGLGGSETVQAVDGVSLGLAENEVLALVGESGCGKTTLGKTAIGLHRPTQGHVRYRGQDVWTTKDASNFWSFGESPQDEPEGYAFSEIRRALQMVHQDPGSSLNPNYTVESTLQAPLKKWYPNLSDHDRRERIYGLLEFAGMAPAEDFASRYPHQLSGGEQQRVALLRALLLDPDVILADEAVSALDVSLRIEMMDLMLRLQEKIDTSFLFVAHDLGNARYLTENAENGRIGIMYLGQLVEIGPPEELIADPKHPYTKALIWSTPDLFTETTDDAPPIRSLDVPEPTDPPTGCRFHTRCPKAREACREENPTLEAVAENHDAACFRNRDDHPYWTSDELSENDGGLTL
jgi:peptide/nickel transport system ATP-binding protein